MSERSTQRVLVLGPLPIAGDVVGGAKLSCARLLERLQLDERLELRVHNTSRSLRGRGRLQRAALNAWALARVVGFLLWNLPRARQVLFLAAAPGLLSAGPLVWSLTRLFRRPLIVRPFGGDLDLAYRGAARWRRRLFARTVLRCDLLLLQTEHLCARFGRILRALNGQGAATLRWFPTIREAGPEPSFEPHAPVRFLFLAQLRPEKGYVEALEASDELPDGATLNVFGPTMPGTDETRLAPRRNAAWRGELPSDEVAGVMAEHDVLVFPTYYEGEGMPGAVVEALQRGLAVVTTRWRSMPELVRDGREGLLVAPRDVEALGAAMGALARNPARLADMRRAARARGEQLGEGLWTHRLADWLTGNDRQVQSNELAEVSA